MNINALNHSVPFNGLLKIATGIDYEKSDVRNNIIKYTYDIVDTDNISKINDYYGSLNYKSSVHLKELNKNGMHSCIDSFSTPEACTQAWLYAKKASDAIATTDDYKL